MMGKKTKRTLQAAVSVVMIMTILAIFAGCSAGTKTEQPGEVYEKQGSAPGASEQPSIPSSSEPSSPAAPKKDENADGTKTGKAGVSGNDGNDIVIQIDDITDKARFYPAEIDGVKLEVLAVKAPDGTIRTAFNTCQVCYDSGRGYYKQEGNVLVCQNCGNRFSMDRVEVESGGCNPVPIFSGDKTVTDTTITISNDFLKEAKVIFGNWKTNY